MPEAENLQLQKKTEQSVIVGGKISDRLEKIKQNSEKWKNRVGKEKNKDDFKRIE